MKKLLFLAVLLIAVAGAVQLRQHVVSEVDLFAVESGSMGQAAPVGSLVAVRPTSVARIGDVVTYEQTGGKVLTHRVVEIDGDGHYITQGDANDWRDPWTVDPALLRGVVEDVYPGWGYALVFLTLPAGIASIASAIITMVLLWKLFFPPEQFAEEATTDKASDPRPHAAVAIPATGA